MRYVTRLRLLLMVGLVGLLFAVSPWWDMLDHQYIYFPEPMEQGDWRAASGLPLEDVWLTTDDGTRLFAWYVEATPRRGVLLWCHGNAGNISHRLDNLSALYRRGLSVLLFDYRGYGLSKGRPSEAGFYQDALAAYDHLQTERGIPSSEVVVFGRSLGSPVAGAVADQRETAGLVLESPFPSVEAVARIWYHGLPVHHLLRARFDLAKRLATIHTPILIIHGDRDEIIPLSLGETVYAAAREPKSIYRIPGAGHNDTYLVGGDAYFQQLFTFVDKVIASASHAKPTEGPS